MPLITQIDTAAVLDRINNMYDDLEIMKRETLYEEFEAWQVDDMHRKYPEITFHPSEKESIVMTRIWPHSRNELPGRRKRLFTIPKNISAAQVRRYRLGVHPHTGRPILRPELFEKLCERMKAMLLTLKWRKSTKTT